MCTMQPKAKGQMMRSGGQVLVQSLVALGATRAFGVPGESYLAVLDALHDTQGRLDFINCRNEGGAAFMAAAWGKLTGSPGICMVTRGPGVTNAAIGIHTAMQDSVPMIVFVGQVWLEMRGREAFQEIDYCAVFGTMAKWVVEVDDVNRLPELLARAWTTALTGRPGPVVVALPEDMLTSLTRAAPLTSPTHIHEPAPAPAAVHVDIVPPLVPVQINLPPPKNHERYPPTLTAGRLVQCGLRHLFHPQRR
jgi:acetolactate synthase-1/2/3 large subunit